MYGHLEFHHIFTIYKSLTCVDLKSFALLPRIIVSYKIEVTCKIRKSKHDKAGKYTLFIRNLPMLDLSFRILDELIGHYL
jgi:hypothetical protein